MEPLYDEKEVEFEVDLNKKFQFPSNIVIKKFEDKNLVIYTEGVLWLVFSDKELQVFNAFSSGASIAELVLQRFLNGTKRTQLLVYYRRLKQSNSRIQLFGSRKIKEYIFI